MRTVNMRHVPDANGETGYDEAVIDTEGATLRQLQDWLEVQCPATRCHHVGDCCGHIYSRAMRITYFDEEAGSARARAAFYTNI